MATRVRQGAGKMHQWRARKLEARNPAGSSGVSRLLWRSARRGYPHDPNQLRLYLAGRMLPDAVPSLINRSQDYENFDLKLNPDDRDLWV